MTVTKVLTVAVALIAGGTLACQREPPAENRSSAAPQPVVDRAAQQAIEAIQTPIDKARRVEGTLSEAAGRTAERANEAAP